MPRSSSSSSSSRSSSSTRSSRPSYSFSSPRTPVTVPSAPTPATPILTHHNQVERPGFFSNMWTGFGLGAGQSIAMNIFRSDPKVSNIQENITTPLNLPKEFVQCMKDNNNNKDLCKQFLE